MVGVKRKRYYRGIIKKMIDAKKKFGQNFLTDKNLLQKIVRDSFIVDDCIEVGPGRGALTNFIVKNAKKVVAYEIDESLKKNLNPIEKENSNLCVVYQDFLDIDLVNERDIHKLSDNVTLIGNLPYYITTPIIFKFIETTYIKKATIMVQKEVGERLSAKENTKQYNALSVIIQYQTDVKKVVSVDKKMFNPVPKVDSVVISIVKKDNIDNVFKDKFISFVRVSFVQKRKTLVNNLAEAYNISKEEIAKRLKKFGLDEKVRAEQIDVNTFTKLTEVFDDVI